MYQLGMLMRFVRTYLYHHTNTLIRQIRYKEYRVHIKLLRHHPCRQSLARRKIVDVYSQIIVDVPKFSLDLIQFNHRSRTGKLKILFNSYFNY
jgi:hypothetical protein